MKLARVLGYGVVGLLMLVGLGQASIWVQEFVTVRIGGRQLFQGVVSGTTNHRVVWSVNGVVGGSATGGVITSTGWFTAPLVVPKPNQALVRATSVADPSKSYGIWVNFSSSVHVTLTPAGPIEVAPATTRQFVAGVAGTTQTSVRWAVNGVAGGNSQLGTISSTGLYRAPSALPVPATVAVSASSVVDWTKSASAKVVIADPPVIATHSLPGAVVGTAYHAALGATGGSPPYVWKVVLGSLPPGLALAPTGAITGTPTTSGAFGFVLQVTDSRGESARTELGIGVAAAPGLPASSLRIGTNDLHLGYLAKPYTAALVAEGGTAPYTWRITSGQLPPGVTLGATTGKLSGTPTAGGNYSVSVAVKDAAGATVSRSFGVSVFEQPLDMYGGLINVPSPHGGTGFFRVEKFGQRWMLVDPLGNAFWLLGVYNTNGETLNSTIVQRKYQGNFDLWATQRNRKLLAWGFNTLGEYASEAGLPVGVWGSRTGNPVQLPFVMIMNGVTTALLEPTQFGLPEAVKDVVAGVPLSAYHGYRGRLVDVYDPKFATAYQNTVGYWKQAITGGFANLPWVLAITTDDTDYLFGFKSRGDAPVATYPNDAFLIAVDNFLYTAAQNPSGAPWLDPKLYSKYAWIDYLRSKYGTVSALNSAWQTGGFYTSFDDAGGFGGGTGVIDEDGRHTAWMGDDPYLLKDASPGVAADLNAFLYQFVKQYGDVAVGTIRAADPNHLIMMDTVNNYGAMARPQVLQALSDAGIQVFSFNYDPIFGPMAGSMAENNQSYDLLGKPAFIWYMVTAQADSAWAASPLDYGQPNFATQAARANHYATVDLPNFVNARGSNGDYYVVGMEWWELTDSLANEHANEGLTTSQDNAYDGREAIRAPGFDSWGFHTGGEAGNYGDFLDEVIETNLNVLRQVVKQIVP